MTYIVSHETYGLDSRIYKTYISIYKTFDIIKEYIITICHNVINNAKYNQYDEYRPYMQYINLNYRSRHINNMLSRHMGQYMPYKTISHIGHNIVHIVRHVVHIIHMPYIVHILRHIRVPNLKIKLKIKFLLSHINISNRNRK